MKKRVLGGPGKGNYLELEEAESMDTEALNEQLFPWGRVGGEYGSQHTLISTLLKNMR